MVPTSIVFRPFSNSLVTASCRRSWNRRLQSRPLSGFPCVASSTMYAARARLTARLKDTVTACGEISNTRPDRAAPLGSLSAKRVVIAVVDSGIVRASPFLVSGSRRVLCRKSMLSQRISVISDSLMPVATGMRLSEITLMRWDNIDFRQRTLLLPDTKNGDARTIPLSTTAITTLLALREPSGAARSGRVFDISPHAVTVSFRRAVRRARAAYIVELATQGKPDRGLLCNLRFHDLRHEAVTRLFEKGLNTIEVGTISGHKTIQTLKRYTHLRATDLVGKLG